MRERGLLLQALRYSPIQPKGFAGTVMPLLTMAPNVHVVRQDDQHLNITLPAVPDYEIMLDETLSLVLPAEILQGPVPLSSNNVTVIARSATLVPSELTHSRI